MAHFDEIKTHTKRTYPASTATSVRNPGAMRKLYCKFGYSLASWSITWKKYNRHEVIYCTIFILYDNKIVREQV